MHVARHLSIIAQLCRVISSQIKHVLTIGKKNLLNRNISSRCLQNMVNFGPLTTEIRWRVWGTPTNFSGVHAWLRQRAGYARNALGTPSTGRASHHCNNLVASGYTLTELLAAPQLRNIPDTDFTTPPAWHSTHASAGANHSLCPPCLSRTPRDFTYTTACEALLPDTTLCTHIKGPFTLRTSTDVDVRSKEAPF